MIVNPTTKRGQSMQTIVAAGTWENKGALVGQELVSDWIQIDEARIPQVEEASFANEPPHALIEVLYPPGCIEGFHLLPLVDLLVHRVAYIQTTRESSRSRRPLLPINCHMR